LRKIASGKDKKIDLLVLQQSLSVGDPDAIEVLYRHFYQRLVWFGRQSVPDASLEQTEDVVQEIFVWLSLHPHKVKQLRSLESYLFQSVRRNLRGDSVRKDKQAQRNLNYLK